MHVGVVSRLGGVEVTLEVFRSHLLLLEGVVAPRPGATQLIVGAVVHPADGEGLGCKQKGSEGRGL